MGNCLICVSPDKLTAVERCGKYEGIRQPGLHVLGADVFGCCIQTRSVSTRIQQNQVTCSTKTKDDVFVEFVIAVQQEVIRSKAEDAIYRLSNPHVQIDSFVTNVIRSCVPKMTLDEVFAAKDELAVQVQQDLESKMTEFGFQIHSALVVDVNPDGKVKDAMNQINANKRLRLAAADKAEADKIIQVKAAEAEAESKFLQGQGIAKQRAAIVEGLKASLLLQDGHASPEKVTELLLLTQFFDTLEKMAQGTATTIFMPHGPAGMTSIADQIRNGVMEGNAGSGGGPLGAPRQVRI
ncbi:unnamed protein product [Amoebophrya sp. A120]|nr:unnamed protein product [Amoebophrya sp. A120]|eukprot:GSA120T00000872001.1